MLDIIIEFLIVFEDKVFEKKRDSKTDKKISPLTIIVLIVFIALIVAVGALVYHLFNK